MNVEPRTACVEDIHDRLPLRTAPAGSPGGSNSRMRAPAQRPGDSVGCSGAPGPTNTRARGTKNEPTSGPAPRFTIDRFHPARVGLGPVGNYYHFAKWRR